MSTWEQGRGQWKSLIQQAVAGPQPVDGALDDFDRRLLDCFRVRAFPGQDWDETRVDTPVPNGSDPGQSFDSMATVVRPSPKGLKEAAALARAGGLEVGLAAPEAGLSVSLQSTAGPEVDPALAETDPDGELFIPSLTKPPEVSSKPPVAPPISGGTEPGAPAVETTQIAPAVVPPRRFEVGDEPEHFDRTVVAPATQRGAGEAVAEPAPVRRPAKTMITPPVQPVAPPSVETPTPTPVADDFFDPPEGEDDGPVVPEVPATPPVEPTPAADPPASASQSGMIQVRDEGDAGETMTRGEIVSDDAPDPVVPRSKIVVSPSASGAFPTVDAAVDPTMDPTMDGPDAVPKPPLPPEEPSDGDADVEELDELDAADVEQLEDTVPPEGSVPAPPPAPVEPPPTPVTAERPPPAPAPATPERPPAPPEPTVRVDSPPPPGPSPAVSGGTMPPNPREWVEEVFADHYAALLPDNHMASVAKHVEFFVQSAGLKAGARVLDVACGGGAHAIALAQRGFEVSGFDAAPAQVARAMANNDASGARVRFAQGDMRSPPFQGPFDAALCIGSSFGLLDDESNEQCLARIAERLAPGGRLLLHTFNRDYMVGRLPTRSWWQGRGCLVLDEAQLDSLSSRVKVHRTVVFEDQRQFDHNYDIRAYGLHDLVTACRRAGLSVVEFSGSLATRGRFFGASSSDIWLLVAKA